MQLCLFKEEKVGLRCQSSASIRHPRFLLFPLLEKGLSKKGKDRSDVSDFILKGAALYAERFVHHRGGACRREAAKGNRPHGDELPEGARQEQTNKENQTRRIPEDGL